MSEDSIIPKYAAVSSTSIPSGKEAPSSTSPAITTPH